MPPSDKQTDLAPITPATESRLPDLGQTIKQLFTNMDTSLFEIKTDQFGPYTPNRVPMWVLKIMRRDPMCRLGLKAIKGPMLKASRYFLHGGDPKVQGFIMHVLRNLLPKLLRTCTNSMDFGFQAHEIVWDETLPTINFKTKAGKKAQIRKAIVPRRIADIDPELVDILVTPDRTNFAGLNVQDALAFDPVNFLGVSKGIGQRRYIPPNKVLLVSNEKEFGNLRGYPSLLTAYNPWWWNNVNDLLWGRFTERLGIGTYIGQAPTDSRTDKFGNRQDPISYLMSILLNLRAAGVAINPYEAGHNGENKWKIELVETKHDGSIFEKRGKALEAKILRALLIPDRLLTAGESGGYASQGVIFEQFFSWLDGIQEENILDPIQEQLIAPMVKYNFGDQEEIPQIRAMPMSPAMRKVYAEIFKTVAELPRKIEGTKRIDNGAIVDAQHLLEALDVPVSDENDWPISDFLILPAGSGAVDPETGAPIAGPAVQTGAKGALKKPQPGPKAGSAPNKKDVTKSDTEKNGAKTPDGKRA